MPVQFSRLRFLEMYNLTALSRSIVLHSRNNYLPLCPLWFVYIYAYCKHMCTYPSDEVLQCDFDPRTRHSIGTLCFGDGKF